MDGEFSLKIGTVETLKKMNSTYHKSHSDYDIYFMKILIKALFPKKILAACSKQKSLTVFNKTKREFAKGIFSKYCFHVLYLKMFSYVIFYTICISFFQRYSRNEFSVVVIKWNKPTIEKLLFWPLKSYQNSLFHSPRTFKIK